MEWIRKESETQSRSSHRAVRKMKVMSKLLLKNLMRVAAKMKMKEMMKVTNRIMIRKNKWLVLTLIKIKMIKYRESKEPMYQQSLMQLNKSLIQIFSQICLKTKHRNLGLPVVIHPQINHNKMIKEESHRRSLNSTAKKSWIQAYC